MTRFFVTVFLLVLSSLATSANLNQVYEWKELDYVWPSEENKTQALKNKTFKPENIAPYFMAVYDSRIFLSLGSHYGIPATLVSLPTSSAASEPPKLTPFPSWELHDYGNCNTIEVAAGLQVDSVGRLWVLDSGSANCKAKLWMIDLNNNDHTKLLHRFPFRYKMHDLVLDETDNGTFAYISRWAKSHIVVYSLESNESWKVKTKRTRFVSIALSPSMEEPRKLYLGKHRSKEIYSISVGALHSGTRTAYPTPIGKWIYIDSYRMLVDNYGTMYSAFLFNDNIQAWNTSQPFQAERSHEIADLFNYWPFTFALDQNDIIWMTVEHRTQNPRYVLLKVPVD